MKVLLDLINEPVPAVVSGILLTFSLDLGPDRVNDCLFLFEGVEFCNFS